MVHTASSKHWSGVVRAGLTIAVCVAAAVQPALAQPASLGPTSTGAASNGGGLNDVAYDDQNAVYLHVIADGQVYGQFVDGAGQLVGGRFAITGPPASFASWARVGFSAGGRSAVFLVTYAAEFSGNRGKSIYGQVVRFNPTSRSGELVGGTFSVSELGVQARIYQEPGGIAFNSLTEQFLVTWADARGSWDIFTRLFDVAGQAVTPELNLTAIGASGEGAPSAAYDWRTNRFLVAFNSWALYNGVEMSGTETLLLDAAGGKIGSRQMLMLGGYQDLPGVIYLPESGNYLAYWRDSSVRGKDDISARLVSSEGTPLGSVFPALATPVFDGVPDADYNWSTRSIFVVGQHDTGYVWGALLDGVGNPRTSFAASTVPPAPRLGSFWPKVVGGPAGQWGVTYVKDYRTSYLERWAEPQTNPPGPRPNPGPPPPPPPPDPTSIDVAGAPNGSEFFAEGVATSDALSFNTYYQIENASDTAATVRAYFARESREGNVTLKERSIPVPANSRTTVDLKSMVGDGPWSAVFQSMTAGAPITTQESVFWGPNLEGNSSETGARTLSPTWLFAEGTRAANDFFSNYFLLFNPGTQPMTVLGEYYGSGAATPIIKPYNLPAAGRLTVLANNELPDLADQHFSARFRAADGVTPFVAQRAMYWGPGYTGGHSSNGATSPHSTWMFAEGASAPNFETYFTLFNPNSFPVDVQVTYLTRTGAVQRPEFKRLDANSRDTIPANLELGNIGGFGATFTTVGGHGIVVERSIYWGGQFPNWVEGTNVAGVNAPAMTWSLPEGSDTGLFDTFILIVNPNTTAVNLRVQFFLEGGGRITAPDMSIPAGTRLTINMNDPRLDLTTLSPGDAALLKGKSFSTKVTSLTTNGPIIVEEAVYRNWNDLTYWRAGASAFGVPR